MWDEKREINRMLRKMWDLSGWEINLYKKAIHAKPRYNQ